MLLFNKFLEKFKIRLDYFLRNGNITGIRFLSNQTKLPGK